MPKGWRISFLVQGHTRAFIVGIADREAAVKRVTAGHSDVYGVDCRPLDEEEFEKLALVDGQVIESAGMGKHA